MKPERIALAAISCSLLWAAAPAPHPGTTSRQAETAADILLSDAEGLAGWGRGATLVDDCKEGKHAVAWTPAPGAPAFLSLALGDKRDAVAHGKTLRFWLKVEGAGLKVLNVKIFAYPLAGGWQAIYNLPVPPAGQWHEAAAPLQQFDDQWGAKPDTRSAMIEFRVETAPDAHVRLLIDDVRVVPLPPGFPVNAGDRKEAEPVKPLIDRSKPLDLPAHPRLLFSAADVAGMKEREAKTDWGRAFAGALRKRGDDWLTRAVDLPPRGGQWWHFYACAKDGALLKTESPTRHVCPLCGKVYAGEPYDSVVLTGRHTALAEAARDLGLLYHLTGDPRYAAKAREILLAYAGRYLTYPLHNPANEAQIGGGRVSCSTLEESIWLIAMAQGADAVWDTLSAEDRETLKTKLFYPAAVDVIGKQPHMGPGGIHNIECWKNSAVGLVGLLFGDAALVADTIDGPAGCQAQMAEGITADGIWFEGSWSYHFYALDALHHLTEAAFRSGINLYGEKYKKMFLAPLDLAMPDGSLPVFNDSMPAKISGNPNFELALARYKDPRLAMALAGGNRRSLQAFINGVLDLPAPPAAAEGCRNFTESGYAVLRAGAGKDFTVRDATWLCLKYGPHGGGHGHPDKNGFALYGAGRVLALDPGTAQYGIPVQSGWYTTTLAHNTLVVDETSQHPATGACLDFQTKEGWSASLTDAGYVYKGVTFRRAAFLIGTDLVAFLDLVGTDDGSARTFDIACHLAGAWTAAPPGAPLAPPDKPGYSYLRDLRETRSDTGMTLAVAAPGGRPAAIVFAPTPGSPTTFWTATGIGKNTEDRVPVVIARRRAASAAFLWAIAIGPTGAAPTIAPVAVTTRDDGAPVPAGEAAAALVKAGDATFLIVANPTGRAIRAGSWTGSERLAVVRP